MMSAVPVWADGQFGSLRIGTPHAEVIGGLAAAPPAGSTAQPPAYEVPRPSTDVSQKSVGLITMTRLSRGTPRVSRAAMPRPRAASRGSEDSAVLNRAGSP